MATTFKGEDGSLRLTADSITHRAGMKRTTMPLDTIQAVTLEDGADLEARLTATRLVLIGVFAFAFKKKKGGERYLTVETTDTVVVVKVDRKDIAKAQQFVAAARTAMKGSQQ